MRVSVVTIYGDSYNDLAKFTIPNMEKYCKIYGYVSKIVHIDDNCWEYKKHEVFSQLFESGFDLVFYRDIDLLFTNLSIPIEGFIDDEHDFYLTRDFTEFNGGSIIIKNTKQGRWINDEILRMRNEFENEQNVINSLYTQPAFRKGVKILSHPSINSYIYSLYPECTSHVGREDLGDWKEGHFVLHVPALSIPKRLEILSQVKITE